MRKRNVLLIIAVLMLSLANLLAGCGGGGADTSRSGGTDATLTAENAAKAGDAVTQALKLVAPATLGQVKAGSVSNEKRAPLISIFGMVAPAIGKQTANEKQATSIYHKDCSGGGSIEVGTPSPVSLDHMESEVTVNSCKIGSETMNGSLKITLPTRDIGDPLHASEYTIEVTNFNFSDSHMNISLTDNFTIVARDFTYNGDTPTSGSITLGGTVTGTIDGHPVDIRCDSLGFQFGGNSSGVTVSVSGRISIACLGGWVTLSTNLPIFVPAGGGCPTGGEIVVSAGGNSVTMHIGSNSGIDIYFNGTLIYQYSNCNEVIGLCVG